MLTSQLLTPLPEGGAGGLVVFLEFRTYLLYFSSIFAMSTLGFFDLSDCFLGTYSSCRG